MARVRKENVGQMVARLGIEWGDWVKMKPSERARISMNDAGLPYDPSPAAVALMDMNGGPAKLAALQALVNR